MGRAGEARLPRELGAAVAALEGTVSANLRDELTAAGAGRAGLAEEFHRRAEDYRTWHRMQEVPDRVADIAASLIRGSAAPATQEALLLAVLAAVSRAHRQALDETGEAGTGAAGTPPYGQ